jgi:hypothetical protein
MAQAFKQSHPIAQFRRVRFQLTNSSTFQGQPTHTFTGSELQICQPTETSWSDFTGSVTEIGSGTYEYTCTTNEISKPGTDWSFKINVSGCVFAVITRDVELAHFITVAGATQTTQGFSSDRTENDNFWKDRVIQAISGSLIGQQKRVGQYAFTGGTFTLVSSQAFSAAPQVGDVFEMLY